MSASVSAVSSVVDGQLDGGVIGFKHGTATLKLRVSEWGHALLLWQRLSAGRLTGSRGVQLASKDVEQVAK